MKKIVFAALAVAALSTVSFAAGKKAAFSFENEIGSNVIDSWHWSSDDDSIDSKTKFAGVYDNVVADYDGGILKVGVDATFAATPWGYNNDHGDKDYWTVNWDGDADWYIEFNPFDMVGFGFSDELYTAGSYLPVFDGNISGGNYSTNGFAVLIRPAKEFTIGAGFDFEAVLDGDDDWGDPALCFGVDYSTDDFSIGGALRHITSSDHRQVGVYVSLGMIDNLVLNLGFTHSADANVGLEDVDYANTYHFWNGKEWLEFDNYSGIYGKNVASAGVVFEAKKFTLSADVAMNFDSDDSDYDFYSAVDFLFGLGSVSKGLGLDVQGFVLFDMGCPKERYAGEELGSTVGVKPQIVFATGKHEFRAGIALQHKFADDRLAKDNSYTYIALPVSWKYTY